MDWYKTEGGFAYDFTKPAAIEKADMMVLLNEIVQMAFPKWSYGAWLDEHAIMEGLSRRAAEAAVGTLKLTGDAGTVIPEGTLFSTTSEGALPNILFEAAQSATIGDTGRAEIAIRAVQGGEAGNVPAHTIALMVEPIAGITSVINEWSLSGGTDEEGDDDLRARIEERNRGIDASYAGSISDYLRWAKEVAGVGDAKVIPEWAGPGTVKVVVVDQNGQSAGEALINRVKEHIMAPADEKLRKAPIGAQVTIAPPTPLAIAVSAQVTLEENALPADVAQECQLAMTAYMAQAAQENVVRLSRVGKILGEADGVVDYGGLLINGQAANVEIGADEYPIISEVALREG